MAVGSAFLAGLDLERHGLRWRWPEIDCAHPLDDGGAGLLYRSVEQTAAGLGADGARWRLVFGGPAANFDTLADDIMGPLAAYPAHPLALARFGAPTVLPASTFARFFRAPAARRVVRRRCGTHVPAAALPDDLGHRIGDPHGRAPARLARRRRRSQAITDALAAAMAELGVKVHTGTRITTAAELPPADITMFDLAPTAVAAILGDRLPRRTARGFRRFRHGPGAFKVDFAMQGPVPWADPAVGRAGTVHLGGDYDEIAATEREIHAGRMPRRPFVLVGQQYLADPARSAGEINPIYAYAHVPHSYYG